MTIVLNPALQKSIDEWLKKFPDDKRQSAVLYALKKAQEYNNGWLSIEVMDAVAAYLGLPKIAVYEVASFYSLYHLTPVGKHVIAVCKSVSCLLLDSTKIVEHLEKRLNIKMGETTSDKKFTLKAVECLAACGGAPAIQIDGVYYENVTVEKIDGLLQALGEAHAS